jgi:hypothetical protein
LTTIVASTNPPGGSVPLCDVDASAVTSPDAGAVIAAAAAEPMNVRRDIGISKAVLHHGK